MSRDHQTGTRRPRRPAHGAAHGVTPDPASSLVRHPFGELGASLVEYALLLALIAVVCIAAVSFMGTQTSTDISDNASSVAGP